MKKTLAIWALALACALTVGLRASEAPAAGLDRGVYAFTVETIDGKPKSLADYAGKVLLIVNVASKCGFTPQYKGLEALYLKYRDRGFMILGFPSNDFLHQEPGTDAEIRSFCSLHYGVTFDLFSKVHVRDEPLAPLYAYLTRRAGHNGSISWNFNKFLVGRDGKVLDRWGSFTRPESAKLQKAIERALAAPRP